MAFTRPAVCAHAVTVIVNHGSRGRRLHGHAVVVSMVPWSRGRLGPPPWFTRPPPRPPWPPAQFTRPPSMVQGAAVAAASAASMAHAAALGRLLGHAAPASEGVSEVLEEHWRLLLLLNCRIGNKPAQPRPVVLNRSPSSETLLRPRPPPAAAAPTRRLCARQPNPPPPSSTRVAKDMRALVVPALALAAAATAVLAPPASATGSIARPGGQVALVHRSGEAVPRTPPSPGPAVDDVVSRNLPFPPVDGQAGSWGATLLSAVEKSAVIGFIPAVVHAARGDSDRAIRAAACCTGATASVIVNAGFQVAASGFLSGSCLATAVATSACGYALGSHSAIVAESSIADLIVDPRIRQQFPEAAPPGHGVRRRVRVRFRRRHRGGISRRKDRAPRLGQEDLAPGQAAAPAATTAEPGRGLREQRH
ncbi:MAG: hypothetical protein BJ554DRAFT_5205, partial [Olpidium bornovanus]